MTYYLCVYIDIEMILTKTLRHDGRLLRSMTKGGTNTKIEMHCFRKIRLSHNIQKTRLCIDPLR